MSDDLCYIFQVLEYQQLEGQLKKTINDLDKREKHLSTAEQQVCI